MKKIIFLIIQLITLFAYSQAPQGINYQSIALNSSNQPINSQPIGLRISILNLTSTGSTLYSESHTPTTNSQGLYTIIIGQGTVLSGTFSTIPWGTGNKFLKVELDPNGGTAYAATGVSQFFSVPYSLNSISATTSTTATTATTALKVRAVTNIAALKATVITGFILGDMITVRGNLVNNDGGGGDFFWNPTDTTIDDGFNTIRPNSNPTNGRWNRLIQSSTDSKTKTIGNIATLLLTPIANITNGDLIKVRGYFTDNDGGGGDFYWNKDDSRNADDGTVLLPSIPPYNSTTPPAGRWNRHLTNEQVNVKWFGVRSTNTSEINVSKINKILLNYKNIFFPEGEYVINEPILLNSNTSISGSGSNSIIKLNLNNAFKVIGESVTNKKNNINISNLNFIDINTDETDNINRYSIVIKNTDNVKIENNYCKGTNLISTNFEAQAVGPSDYVELYGPENSLDDSHLCNNITVKNNICFGGTNLFKENYTEPLNVTINPAIGLFYCNNVVIDSNIIEEYGEGIRWWGGDAAFVNHDNIVGYGDMANTRKTKNYTITNNIVKRARGGGIWGSMGSNISITGNIIEHCLDVGIDSEGSFFVTVTGNSIKNCKNGCLSTFFGNKDVVFSSNVVEQDGVISKIFAVNKNVSQNPYDISVSYIGNTFNYTYRGTDVSKKLGSFGPFESSKVLQINDNKFTNIFIDAIFNNSGTRILNGNSLFFNEFIDGKDFTAIYTGGNNSTYTNNSNLVISNNNIDSKSYRANSTGIYTIQSDPNSNVNTIIYGNKIFNFWQSIAINGNSTSPNIVHKFYINNNFHTGLIINNSPMYPGGVQKGIILESQNILINTN